MPFSDAIPLNRLSAAQTPRFDTRSGQERGRPDRPAVSARPSPRQQVNISPDTLLRVARCKLSKAVSQKLAYGRDGRLGREQWVGQFLSERA